MNFLKNYSQYILNWIKLFRYIATVKEKKIITFYSEGKQYWSCYKGIIDEIIKLGYKIHFVSSDISDPGLNYSSHIIPLLIDERYQRFIFFKTLETKILITTTPDLGNYQDYPKSNKTDYYIYCQHALMSTHYAYNERAFDNFDIILCSGEYMINELRKREEMYNLRSKHLVKNGYSKLDFLIGQYKKIDEKQKNQHILFAPGWNGSHSLLENGKAKKYINKILNQGHKLYFKPHPESLKRSSKAIQQITKEFENNKNFTFYKDTLSANVILASSYLVTDWSGISLEYAFSTGNPVLFIDTPQKRVNKNSHVLKIEAFESSIRDKIGYIWDGEKNISDYEDKKDIEKIMRENIFNINNSDKLAADYISKLLT